MKSFRKDNRGIFWVIFVGITTIMVATATWLIAMLVTSRFIDIFGAMPVTPEAISLGEMVRTQGAAVVVVIDVGMIIWMFVSSFIRERQEMPYSP